MPFLFTLENAEELETNNFMLLEIEVQWEKSIVPSLRQNGSKYVYI